MPVHRCILRIERANICIRGLRTYGNPAPERRWDNCSGSKHRQGRLLCRSCKARGDVVARLSEPVSSETMYLPKSSRDEIYKQLIADLGEAAQLVAWPNGNARTTSTEGINRAFVKAFRHGYALPQQGIPSILHTPEQ